MYMVNTLSKPHQKRFDEIKKSLGLLGCEESNFLKVELLFFEAITISRDYGSDPSTNELLASLKQLQEEQYKKSKEPTVRSSQKKLHIRQFVTGLKKILSHR